MTWWRSLSVLLCILTALASPRSASASSGVEPENRVKAFLLVVPTVVGGSSARSLEKRLGKSISYDESAVGYTLAAEGFTAIGSTGRIGEAALEELGGESQVFFRTSQGGRYIDQLVEGIAHESKVGYTSLTQDVALQISKDAELIATRQIEGATWHFFTSPVTGLGGPSGPLLQTLEEAGIGVVIH